MPCSDVTECIRVVLAADDRLKTYRFVKRTCGQGVGADSLLMEQIVGRTVEELLEGGADDILAEFPDAGELEEFLVLKHFFGVQSALEVLVGREPGGPDDPCAAADVQFVDGETIIDAQIAVDLMTEKIKSCGNCKGCGKKRQEAFERL